jgi:nucleoside 2-deoxyribosyltransferase
MKLYLAIKYYPNQQNRDQIETISSILEQQGFETVCIVQDIERWGQVHFTPAELMLKSFAEIEASDVVVIELTEKGVGVGIEAGLCLRQRHPNYHDRSKRCGYFRDAGRNFTKAVPLRQCG